MHIFGWCNDGMHEGRELQHGTPCPGRYHKKIVETKKRGRKVIETVLVDEMVYCECLCHTGEWPPKKKTRKKRT